MIKSGKKVDSRSRHTNLQIETHILMIIMDPPIEVSRLWRRRPLPNLNACLKRGLLWARDPHSSQRGRASMSILRGQSISFSVEEVLLALDVAISGPSLGAISERSRSDLSVRLLRHRFGILPLEVAFADDPHDLVPPEELQAGQHDGRERQPRERSS